MTSEEFGQDLEHVKVLQKKFDEFHKDLVNHEDRVNEVNVLAEKLIQDQHPEEETVRKRQAVSNLIYSASRLLHFVNFSSFVSLFESIFIQMI